MLLTKNYLPLTSCLISTAFSAEFFSSLQHVKNLKKLESSLVDQFTAQLDEQQEKIDQLKLYLAKLNQTHTHFIGNPVLQYQLIRRMVKDWPEVISSTKDMGNQMQQIFEQESEKHGGTPDESDLDGSADAIFRLQDTYKIGSDSFAAGDLLGSQAPSEFDAGDCFRLGRKAYLEQDTYHAILWMREALKRVRMGDDSTEEFPILDHLSYTVSQWNLRRLGLELNTRIIELIESNPENTFTENEVQRAYGNRKYYKEEIAKGNDYQGEQHLDMKLNRPPHNRYPEFDDYEELCRANNFYETQPEEVSSQLFCTYSNQNNNPRLILKPAKVEVIRLNPTFVIFHDIIQPYEVDVVTALAEPMLNRATIQNPQTGNLETADYRVSKHAWLRPDHGEIVQTINDRIMDYTGLDTTGLASEDLQINDYGIGGQYEPHYDHATKYTAGDFGEERGNRIATVLIYFSDVEKGGNTVFLPPKIVSKPKRGSAVFWYNLKPNGESDDSTRHAGCPILIGQKWVANYWIHERGQEFRRQCELEEDAESVFNIPGWQKDKMEGLGKW